MIEFFQKTFGDLAAFTGFSLFMFVALLVCIIIKFSQLKKSKGESSSFWVDCIAFMSITVGILHMLKYDKNIAISEGFSVIYILFGALYLFIILLRGLFCFDEKPKEERKKLAKQAFSNLGGFFVLVLCVTFASIINSVFFVRPSRELTLLEEATILLTTVTLLNLILIFIYNNFFNKEKKSTKPAFVINTIVFFASMTASVTIALKHSAGDFEKIAVSIAVLVLVVAFYFILHWFLTKISLPKMFDEAVEEVEKEKEKKIEEKA